MLPSCELKTVGPNTLTEALELCFKRMGNCVAIDAQGRKMTYAELDEITLHVASQLRGRFTAEQLKSAPIAILISRSIAFYVAQIAVLRAGGFFLPIDPAQPWSRIRFLLSDSQAPIVLIRAGESSTVADSSVVSVPIDVDHWWEEHRGRAIQSLPTATTAEDDYGSAEEDNFAYMIYTSGSTGRPKGVPISHRSICNLCHWWTEEFNLKQGERTLQMISVGFDASLEEIFPTLVSGGTLVPIQPAALNTMEQFLDFIRRQKIQNLHLPAAFWHTLSASLESHDSLNLPSSVQSVVLGGEKVDPTLVDAWFSQVGADVRLINAYGPTETAVVASCAVLRPDVLPSIGKPIPNVSFCICDTNGQLVENGQPGELYIGGIGVATGYWNREELSAEKFVKSPLQDNLPYYRTGDLVRLNEDGNYDFIGRTDDQIKLRGYRIELGEISACLRTHPQISQAHVAARVLNNSKSPQHLIGYVVTNTDANPSESELREFLSQQLPAYMIPTRIISMETFPVTTGGKLDLDRFPCPPVKTTAGSDSNKSASDLITSTEQKIAKLWAQVLSTDGLSRETNFFHTGGDSLSAMRLVLLLESDFPGPVIPVAALIPNPTIAAMADYIDRRQQRSATKASQHWPLLTPLSGNHKPISIVCMHAAGGGGMFYRQLFEGFEQPILEKQRTVAILESASLYKQQVTTQGLQSIAVMAKDYVDCLIDAGCEKKLTLVGYSFGSLLAFEMAGLLKAKGYEVEKIINIDCPNPATTKPRSLLSKFWCRIRSHETLRNRLAQYKLIIQRKWNIGKLKRLQKANLPTPVKLRPLALELVFKKMAESYPTKRLDIKMHLISGQYPQASYHVREDYGWTDMVSSLTTAKIPGGHNTIFCQPYLEPLKKAFHEALSD